MDRRSFLVGTVALGASLAGCSSPEGALRVRSLRNSIPAQLVSQFRKQFNNAAIEFKPEDQLQELFTLLQTWKQQVNQPPQSSPIPFSIPSIGNRRDETPSDLVTLGDYWLSTAIRQGLIQPLDPKPWEQWNQLPEKWRTIVTRSEQGNLATTGKVWGAPYRWGSTVIAYRADIFRQKGLRPLTDWGDLWREDLKGRISLLDQPRETIGLVLKKLGRSYNTPDLSKVQNLESELQALHRQTKFYSSDTYLQPLVLSDTWVAIGWSTDVLPLMRRNSNIEAVFPTSGTALWADVWVRPATVATQPSTAQSSALAQWINFCWQPQIAPQLSLLSQAASPILTALNPDSLPEELRRNSLLFPKAETLLNRSEFLEPISDATVEQYRSLWAKIRQA
jgi:putative spermidine/putrescine transport system substrate-binding protein